MIRKILVPVDGSESSQRAIVFASEIAAKFGASVTFVHILQSLLPRKQLKEYLSTLEAAKNPDRAEIESIRNTLAKSGEKHGIQLLENAEILAKGKNVEQVDTVLRDGDPAEEILHMAESGGHDIIIMGRRGHGPIRSLLVGSVSNKVAGLAPCTVVTVR
ncbi:MAG: universal stress protein [Candidatus Loosdrechtia sp.]|uniref:universal stress protein n=1 Tax=Candidatus Loosdrechtia sp. TaxID=3101272 RepID=UPI003A63F47B|nr:MAG: universal stress protein [Candidatus Jettenia sp. AMX2]